MKRKHITLVTAALTIIFATTAFALDTTAPSQDPAAQFEKMKADSLKKVDDRIKRLQEEKTCLEGATNHDDLINCRWKNKNKGSSEWMRGMQKNQK